MHTQTAKNEPETVKEEESIDGPDKDEKKDGEEEENEKKDSEEEESDGEEEESNDETDYGDENRDDVCCPEFLIDSSHCCHQLVPDVPAEPLENDCHSCGRLMSRGEAILSCKFCGTDKCSECISKENKQEETTD